MEQCSPPLTAADCEYTAPTRDGAQRVDYARVAPDALRALLQLMRLVDSMIATLGERAERSGSSRA